MTISFDGQVAIVTGAGRGMGRAYALDFARRGAKVVVNDIEESVAQSVVDEIEGLGGAAVACTESAASYEGTQAIVATALDTFGELHVVVNNASVFRMGYFDVLERQAVVDMYEIHMGYLWLVQHAWPVFQRNNYGRVVLTSSSAIWGHAGAAHYAAAKASVVGLARALYHEAEPIGVKVNVILPSARTQEYRLGRGLVAPGMAERFAELDRRSHGRIQPEWNAHLVTYLASRECKFNGESFHSKSGAYSRVFIGVTDGWVATDDDNVSAETIAEHIDEITEIHGYAVPQSSLEETNRVLAMLDEALGPHAA